MTGELNPPGAPTLRPKSFGGLLLSRPGNGLPVCCATFPFTAVVIAEGLADIVFRRTGADALWLIPAVLRIEGLSARGSNCGAVFNAMGFDFKASAARAEKNPTEASSGILVSGNGEPSAAAVALLSVIALKSAVIFFDRTG